MGENGDKTTLRAVLTLPEPTLSYRPADKDKNPALQDSSHRDLRRWPKVDDRVRWDDFKAKTLNNSHLGDFLDCEIDASELAPLPGARSSKSIREPALEFDSPAGIGAYLIKRNHEVLQPTLKFAKARLDLRADALLESNPPQDNNKESVMWCKKGAPRGFDHDVTLIGNSQKKVLVVGLCRPSTAFDAHLVLGGKTRMKPEESIRKESDLVLRQLAHHCMEAAVEDDMPCGYIMTEKTVTCCRFSKLTSSAPIGEAGWRTQNVKRMRVEIADIPRGISGKRELTTDVALWWLCMMRLSELEKEDPTRVSSQETPEIQDQQVDMEFDAPMSVFPPPFQVSGAGDVGNQQENEAPRNQLESDIESLGSQNSNFEQADQMLMDSDYSNNLDALVQPAWYSMSLATMLANVTETPRNVFYTPPPMMGSYNDEMPNWRCESPAGQPQMDAQAATPGYDSTPITTESSPASSAY